MKRYVRRKNNVSEEKEEEDGVNRILSTKNKTIYCKKEKEGQKYGVQNRSGRIKKYMKEIIRKNNIIKRKDKNERE